MRERFVFVGAFILCFVLILMKSGIEAQLNPNNDSVLHILNAFWESHSQSGCTNKFECRSSECIEKSLRCNGHHDCSDGSDEDNCDFIKCLPPNYFNCSDSLCIPFALVCNGVTDCKDGFDEKNCNQLLKSNKNNTFTCSNKRIISLEWTCDGYNDCYDNSDETIGCENKVCPKGDFQCKNKICIESTFRCDGIVDCSDKSDETDCDRRQILDMTNCTMEKSKYACKDRFKCIDLSDVCNDDKDCYDGSDEGGFCLNKTTSSCNKCNHFCAHTPDGNFCVCRPGFMLSKNDTCLDINECQEFGICDEKCVNTAGSYHCECDAPYLLQADKKSCKLPGSGALLFYSTSSGVKAINTDTYDNYSIGDPDLHTTAIQVFEEYVYLSILHEGSPVIVRISGDVTEIIVSSGLGVVEDLAVDKITGNIYFTDSRFQHVGVCSFDGRTCTILHNNGIDKPRAISLSSKYGLMFWSDWGHTPLIAKCGMDGSDPEVFVHENIHWPMGITCDTPNSRLYWVDSKLETIESIKFDGTDRRVVLPNSVKQPFAIVVFENKLYWTNVENNEILECDKFTGKNKKSLVRDASNKIYNIHAHHHELNFYEKSNPCAENKCSDLCLLSPTQKNGTKYSCACPDDKQLDKKGKFCNVSKYRETLVVGFRNILYIIEHQHLGRPKIKPVHLNVESVTSIVYNPVTDDILIADGLRLSIWSYNVQTENLKFLCKSGFAYINSMKFDEFGNNLYWCDSESLNVEALSLNTYTKTIIVNGYFTEIPIDLALVPEKGFMFVAFMTTSNKIRIDRISMDGDSSTRIPFVKTGLVGPEIRMHYDRRTKQLAWANTQNGCIETIDLDGKNRILRFSTDHPMSISFFYDTFFWTKRHSYSVYWRHIDEKVHDRHLKLPIGDFKGDDEIHLLTLDGAWGNVSACQLNNGNCSHLCLQSSSSSHKQICACPIDLVLSVDGRNCLQPRICLDSEFRCHTGECIPLAKVCDTNKDCLHGDDEFLTNCLNYQCPDEQFLCFDKKKCVDRKLQCDGHFDCEDHSDEICRKNCSEEKFWCKTGECIEPQFRCDGRVDCRDGLDEKNCLEVNCGKDKFRCKSGQCISKSFHCDGEYDCIDGSDESTNCTIRNCLPHEYLCTNKVCVDMGLTCNGVDNCGDNSDEHSSCISLEDISPQSDVPKHLICNPDTQFACQKGDGYLCIPKRLKCNGVRDCPAGEDEKCDNECLDDQFRCNNKRCIPQAWICDLKDDCGDGSDELKEACLKINQSDAGCLGFRCGNGQCIPNSNVCNNITDCADKSDEGGRCGKGCENFGCAQKCLEQPLEPKCSCENGFKLSSDNKTCVDINECQLDICAQNCTNTPGSFICECFSSEFSLRTDHVSCKANGGPINFVLNLDGDVAIFSNNKNHLKYNYSSSSLLGGVLNMDVDNRRSRLYLAGFYPLIVRRDIKNNEIVMKEFHGGFALDFVVDWITENIYSITYSSQIVLSTFNDSRSVIIYEISNAAIYKIAIDPIAGYIFWFEFGTELKTYKIQRADCSGRNVKTLTKDIGLVNHLIVDSYERYIYFSNINGHEIIRMNYDGNNMKRVLHTESIISSFSFFENSIYWASKSSVIHPIRKCKIYGLPPRKCEVVKSPIKQSNIHFQLIQENRQRDGPNPCLNSGCREFCVVSESGPVCLCRNKDGRSNLCALNETDENNLAKTLLYGLAIIVMICFIIVVSFMAYHHYNPKSLFLHRYRFNFRSGSPDKTKILSESKSSGINELNKHEPEFLQSVTEEQIRSDFDKVRYKATKDFS